MGSCVRPRVRAWLQEHRHEIDAVVLDIDGVLVRHRRALEGSVELMEQLRASSMPYSLLTNDGCSSVAQKSAYLASVGIRISSSEICSSGHAIASWAEHHEARGQLFHVVGSLGKPCFAEVAGLRVSRDLEQLDSVQGVLIGETGYDWEPTINAIINLLIRRPGLPVVVPNPDLYFPLRDSEIRLASGAVAFLVQEMVRRHGEPCDPEYLGKPHAPIFSCNHDRLEQAHGEIGRARVLMVGDSLEGDIAGANAYGYRSGLVLTGLTTPAMLERSSIAPEMVFQGL